MRQTLGKLRPWMPALIWMGLIFFVSHQPSQNLPDLGQWTLPIGKMGHFFAYAALAILLRPAAGGDWRALGIAALYAMSDEFHQSFVPGRNASWLDVLLDCAGGLAGLTLRRIFTLKRFNNLRLPPRHQQQQQE